MVEADPRTGVDVVGGPEALLVRPHGFGQERHQDAVDDEPGPVGRDDDLFAERRAELADGGFGRVTRVARPDELDERHDRHRAEEVHPDEPLAAVAGDRFGQSVDRDRRGVRGEDRFRARDRVELPPQGRLDGEVLEDGFDDQVDVGDARELGAGFDAGEGGVTLVPGEAALGERPVEVAGDPVAARLRSCQVGLVEGPPASRSPRAPGRSRGPSAQHPPRRPARSRSSWPRWYAALDGPWRARRAFPHGRAGRPVRQTAAPAVLAAPAASATARGTGCVPNSDREPQIEPASGHQSHFGTRSKPNRQLNVASGQERTCRSRVGTSIVPFPPSP